MKEILKKIIPDFIIPQLQKLNNLIITTVDRLYRRKNMLPPKSMIFTGSGDFIEIGQEFKNLFIELGGLQPNSKVLDVGCGIGRMAIPLTKYLSDDGEYWGFDIVPKGIAWCQNNISSKYSNFHFFHSDVYNKHYNKEGEISANRYCFPFKDNTFDFVFLTSVFTHMLPKDMENYLSEISRVLKMSSKCLITYFILNNESESLLKEGQCSHNFRYQIENAYTVNINDPEAAIAYKETYIKGLFDKHHLQIVTPIHYGNWCNREEYLSFQDIIIASKFRLT